MDTVRIAIASEGYTQYVITCNGIQALHLDPAPKKSIIAVLSRIYAVLKINLKNVSCMHMYEYLFGEIVFVTF